MKGPEDYRGLPGRFPYYEMSVYEEYDQRVSEQPSIDTSDNENIPEERSYWSAFLQRLLSLINL